MNRYIITLSLSSSIFLCAMDKPEVSLIRDQIDEKMLEVKPGSWGRSLKGYFASAKKSWSLDEQATFKDLQDIESYVPEGSDKKEIYETLYQRHLYFYYLVEQASQVEAKTFDTVSGSTIDGTMNKLHDSQRTIGNLSPVMSSLITQLAKPKVFERIDCPVNHQHIYWEDLDIHLRPLFAQKHVSIRYGGVGTSLDGKYAKSMDEAGNSIIWNLEKGHKEDIDGHGIAWEWVDFRENYTVDRYGKYAIFANPCYYGSLGTAYPKDLSLIKNVDAGGYMMLLFKKPTRESRLCAAAFKNSRGNKEELVQLLNSETFKKVQGFPAENLKYLINKELEGLQQAKL